MDRRSLLACLGESCKLGASAGRHVEHLASARSLSGRRASLVSRQNSRPWGVVPCVARLRLCFSALGPPHHRPSSAHTQPWRRSTVKHACACRVSAYPFSPCPCPDTMWMNFAMLFITQSRPCRGSDGSSAQLCSGCSLLVACGVPQRPTLLIRSHAFAGLKHARA